ncbi:SpoIIE family protein phosphatase [Blastococcus capsensis]|nr:SpoIIE family protein phosphatase [Blastococcus capsensis]MDK3257532.1 SpoIIE family protein phosphatase [Blastococcus capsensis]
MSEHGGDTPATQVPELPGEPDAARRALLDLAVTAAGVGMFDWVLAADDLGWDERLIELFGYHPASFDRSFESFTARVHPEDIDRVTALLQHAVDTVGEYSAEYRVALPDGGTRWLAARGRALADEAGTTVRVIGAAWDITERRAEQEHIAQIVDSMAVGFVAMDHDWVITHVNTEAERIAGRPRDQLLGRTLWEQFPATVGTEFEEHYRRAAATGRTQALDAYYPEPLDVWLEVRAVPGPAGIALHFVDITARALAAQQAERAAARQHLLSRITENLAGTLDADDAATRLARLITPAVADWCIVTLIDDTSAAGDRRGLRAAASWHADPALRGTAEAYAQSRLSALDDDAIVIRALRTGHAQHLPTGAAAAAQDMLATRPARDLMAALSPEALAVLPLPGRTGPVGLLTVCNGAGRGPFTPEDLVTVRHVADRAGLVLDNARLYRQQRDLAEGFQRSLLTAPPQPDHGQIVVRYVPAAQAAEVGGDWYDAFLQPGGATALVIGDVVGHDTQAAAAMGQIRTIVRTLGARDDDGPAAVVAQADRVMQTLRSAILATAVVARLEQTEGEREQGLTRLRWSNAGHPPPMILTADGRVEVLTAERADLLLGVDPSATRRESVTTLDRDAVVLLYTDGLVERRGEDLDDGLARLQATLAGLVGRDLDELVDEVLAQMLPAIPDDDVALIAVRLHRQDRPRPAEAGPTRVPPNVPAD